MNNDQTPQNRFIYVKSNFFEQPPKVHVNPHFKKTVYVNPQFKAPKIHVNPNVLTNLLMNQNLKKPEVVAKSPLEKKRRNSIHSKYKIVRSKSPRKRKISDFSARKKLGYVNISGVLYKNSKHSLKRALETSTNLRVKKALNSSIKTKISRFKLVRNGAKVRAPASKTVIKRFKVIRPKKTVSSKAPNLNQRKKNNMPCQTYRKFGKCPRKSSGKCFKVHNPDQIVLCTRFLQGACLDEKCLLSHKVSLEKMPTCKYFLEGLCSKDNCPYLHVKINPNADICASFLQGFCRKGSQCNQRHQFLCPHYEKTARCPRKQCPYPHGNSVRKRKLVNCSSIPMSVHKKSATMTKKRIVVRTNEKETESERYYKEEVAQEAVAKTVARDRPKLGDLPAFIPFTEL